MALTYSLSLPSSSVTAIADKLDLEFALFHKKRDGKTDDAPEKMELLVGDVKGKVRIALSSRRSCANYAS